MDCLRLILPNLQPTKSQHVQRPKRTAQRFGPEQRSNKASHRIPKPSMGFTGVMPERSSVGRPILRVVWCFLFFCIFPVFWVLGFRFKPKPVKDRDYFFSHRATEFKAKQSFLAFISFRVPKTFQIFPLPFQVPKKTSPSFRKPLDFQGPFFAKKYPFTSRRGSTQWHPGVSHVSRNPRCTLGAEPMLMDRTS